ncbi:MAG: Gfo/Idh/MocA family oxidoreductase [Pseudonocardia sp.]|nr:Gfo/Idh/MocA family oxidoreductase [Pseudonocardia sp.]
MDAQHDAGAGADQVRLRVALVGAGLVGQAAHAITLAEDRTRFDFVAVVDPSPTVRAGVAARYGVPHAVGTLAEAVGVGLDAVVVAVPDPAHLDSCLEALAAGLHVFCEKPLVTRLADADALIAARGERVLQCGYMKLYDPAVERVVELLGPDDHDGPAELVYLSIEVNDPDQGPFVDHLGLLVGQDVPASLVARTRAAAARAVDDTLGRPAAPAESRAFEAYLGALVHDVSLAHHVLDALGHKPPLPIADAAYFDAGRGVSLSWALDGGARVHLTHLNLPGVSDYTERVTIFCRDRILELTFPSPYLRFHPTQLVEKRSGSTSAALETTHHRLSYEESFRNELRAFHASVTTGAPVRASAEAAREDLRALLVALQVAADGAPPEKED